MSLVELSAFLNIVHKFAGFKKWWRRKFGKNIDVGNLESASSKVSIIKKEQKKRFPALILPQEFEFVELDSVVVELCLSDGLRSSKGFSINYELKVRRIDEIEITLLFTDAKIWSSLFKKEFYLTVDTSNSSGNLVGCKDIAEEYIEEDMVAFAYISQIRFKHKQEHWSIEGKKNTLCEDTFKSLGRLIEQN